MPSAEPGAPVVRPADVEAWLTDLGVEPLERADRDSVTSWDLVLDGRRRFDLSVTLILDPSLGLICWAHYAPPINDMFRKSYRRLLRWNDEFPFAKFSIGEDERPLLAVELPSVRTGGRSGSARSGACADRGGRRRALRRVGRLVVARRKGSRPVRTELEERAAHRRCTHPCCPSCSTAARLRARTSPAWRSLHDRRPHPASRVDRPRAGLRDRPAGRPARGLRGPGGDPRPDDREQRDLSGAARRPPRAGDGRHDPQEPSSRYGRASLLLRHRVPRRPAGNLGFPCQRQRRPLGPGHAPEQ